jgi:hypothetical protein
VLIAPENAEDCRRWNPETGSCRFTGR